ncbi:hypothetical protein [Glaciimonas soli]|uniref:Uncharacterized protein n=1 Tax=Glaciimonas soli TaxID=2590999 RepID=A0A843YNR4_9BURK|nr:hypothetical protein [Glaciimonas soli]MQR01115.1 hypothetical protein [Glaciimonas soli]
MNRLLKVETVKTSHGKERKTTYQFDFTLFGCTSSNWLGIVLQNMAARSLVSSMQTPDFRLFRLLLEELKNNIICRNIYTKYPGNVTRKDMHILFAQMENCLEDNFNWGPAVKARASMHFRRSMIDEIPDGAFGESLSRHNLSFQTKLTGRHPPRATLSEMDVCPDGSGLSPIDAIPHTNVRDLRSQISQRLDLDLNKLINICISEIDFWAETRKKLVDLGSRRYSKLELAVACNFLKYGADTHRNIRIVGSIKPRRLIGACAQVCQDKELVKAGFVKLRGMPLAIGSNVLEILGLDKEQVHKVPAAQILQLPLRVHYYEIAAAFVLLLANTAWNANSLRQMPVTCIQRVKNGFVIQGFKRKTGQHTPEVFIDSANKGGIQALELILWNHAQLKSFGFIAENDHNCWYAWPRSRIKHQTEAIEDLGRAIKLWVSKYGIRRFSLDQIRTHMLVRIAVSHGTAEAARAVAGHSSISTTGSYLDQFLTNLLSKSINLEFQRRIEAQVAFNSEATSLQPETTDNEVRPHSSLFKSVGDGTTCSNPRNPPNPSWLSDSQCDARSCHLDGGCTNNRIEITKDRLEEIVRLNFYYQNHWRHLYQENSEKFEKFHGQAILFNSALFEYLKSSVLQSVITALEEKIKREIAS